MKNPSSQRMVKIVVLSNHKACKLLLKLFSNDQSKFQFIDFMENNSQEKIDILILDEAQYLKCQSLNTQIPTIILKDTQKSDASILALSGQLSTFGQNHKQQFIPSYIVDFIVAISLSILIRQIVFYHLNNKKPITFHVSLIDLAKYFGAFNMSAKQNGFLRNPLGNNLLDGGAPFYRLYECKENTIAVGNLEPKFFQQMIKGFQLSKQKQSYLLKNQFNTEQWHNIGIILKQIFLTKTASQWEQIMSNYDTCVTKVKQNYPQIEIPQPRIHPLVKPKL